MHIDFIKDQKIAGKLTWQILKKELFYYILNSKINSNQFKVNEKSRVLFFNYWSFFIKSKSHIVFSNSVDRQLRFGKLYNDLFQNVDKASKSSNHFLLEIDRSKKKSTSYGNLIPNGYYHENIIELKLVRTLLRIVGFYKKQAKKWEIILNDFLIINDGEKIDFKVVWNLILTFYSEYFFWKVILFFKKPRSVFFSDSLTTGRFMAFSKKWKTYEFQHGIISRFKPDYIFLEELFVSDNEKLKPTKICLFDSYSKQVLLKSKFWKLNDILITGNPKVENLSLALNTTFKQFQILIIDQPFFYHKKLIEIYYFLKNEFEIPIFFKIHPRNEKRFSELEKLKNIQILKDFSEIDKGTIVVGFHSQLLIELAYLGFSIVSFDFNNSSKYLKDVKDIETKLKIKFVYSNEELLLEISNLLTQKKELRKINYKPINLQNMKCLFE